jgi:hypothetical protein
MSLPGFAAKSPLLTKSKGYKTIARRFKGMIQADWRLEMTIPGFHASASFYGGTNVYRTATLQRSTRAITPALDMCTCTSPNCTWQCPPPPPPPPPDCSSIGCPAGQLCCVGPTAGSRLCVTPNPTRDGHQWCGQTQPFFIGCLNCPPGQTCGPICKGELCSVDLYCQ